MSSIERGRTESTLEDPTNSNFVVGGQGGPNLPPPVPCNPGSRPFFLGFLPFALFRLRNIMQCYVISPYFSRFPPFWNSHLPPFPLPPPVPLPPPILPGSRPPVSPHSTSKKPEAESRKRQKWGNKTSTGYDSLQ